MTAQWRTSLLRSDRTIQEAAELLTENSLRIVLVIDEQSRLLGTVTDGDIRRSLMAGHRMTAAVTTMMQASPIALTQGDSRGKALQIMREKDLLHLPVLDSKGFVVGLETMRNLVFEAPRSNAVVLMAGGFGQRLYPLTRDVPKPLLPVGEKPILENTLEQLVDGGFSRFYLAVHYRAEQVREHFGDGTKWGVTIEYLEERQPLGTGGAVHNVIQQQNLKGQRVSKVMKSIIYVEKRVNALIGIWGKEELDKIEVLVEKEKTADEKLLSGPQLEGKGISQDEIDSLFD